MLSIKLAIDKEMQLKLGLKLNKFKRGCRRKENIRNIFMKKRNSDQFYVIFSYYFSNIFAKQCNFFIKNYFIYFPIDNVFKN